MINAGGVYSELVLDSSKFDSGMQKASQSMQGIEGKLNNMGKSMQDTGKKMTTLVTVPIMGVAAAATKIGVGFESSMSEVSAISGATGQDLQDLESLAREMGATTKFSASDAADGLKYMAMAGWETQQMMDGLPGILDLAAASGESLGTTSDIVTDALTAFGLKAADSAHFADVLAQASSSSNTNVGLMGETFKYAAPLAGALGFSIEDTALAIGLMANAGIKGSQAGTALRAIFSEMTGPMDIVGEKFGHLSIMTENTDGSMRDLSEIINDVRELWPHLTEAEKAHNAETMVGKQAMSGWLAIMNSSEEDFNKLQTNIDNSTGAAKRMSDEMQNNLKGRWEEFKSLMEEVALKIYDILLPSLEKILDKGTAFLKWFDGLDDGTKKTILNFVGLAAAIGPVLLVGGKFATSISSIIGLMGKFGGAATVAGTATTTMGGGIGLAGAAAKASALLLNPWVLGLGLAAGAAVLVARELRKDTIPAMVELDGTVSEATKSAITNFLDMEREAKTAFNQMAWSGMAVTEEMKNTIVENTNQMADDVIAKLEEQKIEGLKHITEMVNNSIDMSEEEKKEVIRIAGEKYDEEIKKAIEGKARIEEILETAKTNNTRITDEERIEIETIMEDLKDSSIRLMSESQTEQEAILENLKINADRITAEMMLEIVANSKEQKEKSVEQAEKQYKESLAYAELLKKDGTKESIDLADKVIKEAERQRDGAVTAAEDMHNKVLKEVEKQGGDIVKQLDFDNNRIKSKWDELKEWFNRNPIVRKIQEIREEHSAGTAWSGMRNNAHGTPYFEGGLTWVGEQGRELIDLPKGTKIHSNQKSEAMTGGEMKHSGTIRVEGVNDKNELVGTVEIVVKDILRREVRT